MLFALHLLLKYCCPCAQIQISPMQNQATSCSTLQAPNAYSAAAMSETAETDEPNLSAIFIF